MIDEVFDFNAHASHSDLARDYQGVSSAIVPSAVAAPKDRKWKAHALSLKQQIDIQHRNNIDLAADLEREIQLRKQKVESAELECVLYKLCAGFATIVAAIGWILYFAKH